jgi:16S rRNA processing protein RimM
VDRLVAIGEIARPHGLRGEVRVTPLTDRPARFEGLSTCLVWDPAADRREPRRITGVRGRGPALLLSLEGCETVEAARALVGRLIAVPENEALPPPPGWFYPWQLAGCRAVTETGEELGTVVGIESTGAQELWVLQGPAREHLVPAVPDIVLEVDLAARRVVLRPPEGLLEL